MELCEWVEQKNLRVSSVYDLGHQVSRVESLTSCLVHGERVDQKLDIRGAEQGAQNRGR